MEYRAIDASNREEINAFIRRCWYTTDIALRGTLVDTTKLDGIAGYEDGKVQALITYAVRDEAYEIITLDSLQEGKGIASALIRMVTDLARGKGCQSVIVVTTNDNIRAIRFYQKRGFDMARLYHNALDLSRKLKPEIPLVGEDGIPLRHEIEFVYDLTMSGGTICE